MAVVINEFEVVAEAPAAPEGGGPAASPPAPAGPSTPYDIATIVRHQHERLARVRAH